MTENRLNIPFLNSPFIEKMALTIAILSTGIVFLDQSGVNVALPAIQKSLNADIGALQWILDIYLLVLSILMLIGGVLGDIFGRVRVYIIGMVIFIAASVLCGLAPTTGWLIMGRFLQGVGGSLVAPGGLAIINAVVAPERRGRMLGIWGTFAPLITIAGPVIGGWLVDFASWRAVFYINLPLGLLAIFIAWRFVPESRNETIDGRLDWLGLFTLMVGLGGVLISLIEGPNLGWANPWILLSITAGVIGLAAFVWIESWVPAPLIPLHLFKIPEFTGVNLMTVILYFGLGGPFFFITLNLQQIQGYTASQAGLAIMPITIVLFLMARKTGALTDRWGARPLIIIANLLIALSFAMLMWPSLDQPYWTHWLPGIIVYGIGLGFLIVPITSLGLQALPQNQSGTASGVNNAASRLGQMLSIAILGAVMTNRFRSGMINRIAELELSADVRTQLLLQARSLGETIPPAGLSPETTAAIEQAIRLSFVDGFRTNMFISAVLVLASLGILLATIPKGKVASES
ncbi:MAG: EmrB/QacA subfamily drug resistance transporter, partial [Candidatus Promineifilaceae bacterium]